MKSAEFAVYFQIAVADVDEDGQLNILGVNRTGSLVCVNLAREVVWSTSLGSTSTGGLRLADIDADGFVDVVVATSDGWVISD